MFACFNSIVPPMSVYQGSREVRHSSALTCQRIGQCCWSSRSPEFCTAAETGAVMQAPQLPRQPPALSAFGVTPAPPQPSTLLGIPLTGTVDSQFDAGYFVTIHAGTQEFKGEENTHSVPSWPLHLHISGVAFT